MQISRYRRTEFYTLPGRCQQGVVRLRIADCGLNHYREVHSVNLRANPQSANQYCP
jgi:hypothetical protein